MINSKKKLILALLVLLSGKLFALDLTVIGGMGNFLFDDDIQSPQGGTEPFKGSLHPLGRITVKDQVSPVWSYTVTAERDPLLRTVLSGEMSIDVGYVNLSVGPLFSLFNAPDTLLRPGVSAGIRLDFPGVIFFNIRGGATLGSIREHDYGLETGTVSLGFWLPNLLSTISVTNARFGETSAVYVEDESFRVCYRAEVFEKNVPYTIVLEMGYQTLKRSYMGVGSDLVSSVFLGFETAVNVRPQLTLHFGVETQLTAWGQLPLERAKDRRFFRAFTGFTWNFASADGSTSPPQTPNGDSTG